MRLDEILDGMLRAEAEKQKPTDRDKRKAFYASKEWRNSKARYQALAASGGKCQACGASPTDGVTRLVVDHIKPIRKNWMLRFAPANCQVLCQSCNLGKSSDSEEDWRAL